MKYATKLTKELTNIPDLIIRKIKYNFSYVYIFYIETINSSNKINDYILKNITNPNQKRKLKNIIAAPNLKNINYDEINNYIFSGYSIIIYLNKIYALETRADLDRSITNPEIEQDLYGSRDSLIENYQKNIGLVKKRIKSENLKTKEYKLGRLTNTTVGILYMKNIIKDELLEEIDSTLSNIDTDEIIDAGELKQYLTKTNKSLFPLVKLTERPDAIVKALTNGKAVIIMDTCPFAILTPSVLADFINPISDIYLSKYTANILKAIRLICFMITIFTPAIYISVINYNQETIPSNLLTSFITQRQGVPFPAIAESFFMLFICEILRECDIRFPNNFSSSISILGALILGEAAVSASIVSPIMIIVVAITFISSMIFSNAELSGAIRAWRFISLFVASLYGLFGVALTTVLLIVNLSSITTFKLPYTFPLAPLDKVYLSETLFKKSKTNEYKRSKYLTNNIRKQR